MPDAGYDTQLGSFDLSTSTSPDAPPVTWDTFAGDITVPNLNKGSDQIDSDLRSLANQYENSHSGATLNDFFSQYESQLLARGVNAHDYNAAAKYINDVFRVDAGSAASAFTASLSSFSLTPSTPAATSSFTASTPQLAQYWSAIALDQKEHRSTLSADIESAAKAYADAHLGSGIDDFLGELNAGVDANGGDSSSLKDRLNQVFGSQDVSPTVSQVQVAQDITAVDQVANDTPTINPRTQAGSQEAMLEAQQLQEALPNLGDDSSFVAEEQQSLEREADSWYGDQSSADPNAQNPATGSAVNVTPEEVEQAGQVAGLSSDQSAAAVQIIGESADAGGTVSTADTAKQLVDMGVGTAQAKKLAQNVGESASQASTLSDDVAQTASSQPTKTADQIKSATQSQEALLSAEATLSRLGDKAADWVSQLADKVIGQDSQLSAAGQQFKSELTSEVINLGKKWGNSIKEGLLGQTLNPTNADSAAPQAAVSTTSAADDASDKRVIALKPGQDLAIDLVRAETLDAHWRFSGLLPPVVTRLDTTPKPDPSRNRRMSAHAASHFERYSWSAQQIQACGSAFHVDATYSRRSIEVGKYHFEFYVEDANPQDLPKSK